MVLKWTRTKPEPLKYFEPELNLNPNRYLKRFDTLLKTNQFSGEDLFFFFLLWNSHISGPKTHDFDGNELFFWFLVFTYFWTEKGWHHEIPPWMPPFLATPLVEVRPDGCIDLTGAFHS